MKKKFMFLVAAFAIGCSSMLISCSKSNADVIKQYEAVCNEIVEAANSGDMEKAKKVEEKAEAIKKEMEGREFTPEEQQEILDITTNMFQSINIY